jgi:hypothetical protein
MKWAWHIAYIGRLKMGTKFWFGKPEGRRGDHLEDLGIVGR